MTKPSSAGDTRRVDDFLDIRRRLLDAVARRNAEVRGSPAWRAAEADVQALSRRVLLTREREAEDDDERAEG